jgi:hypothetical protein
MSEFTGVFNDEQKRTLALLRIIWVVLAVEIVALGVIVYLILAGRQGGGAAASGSGQTLLIISIVAVIGSAALGYFLRMQAYKKHWVGSRIERAGYFTGNLLLFALIEAGALVAVVCAYLAGGVGQELMPLVLSLILLALNFPNGRPMLHEGGHLPDNLTR